MPRTYRCRSCKLMDSCEQAWSKGSTSSPTESQLRTQSSSEHAAGVNSGTASDDHEVISRQVYVNMKNCTSTDRYADVSRRDDRGASTRIVTPSASRKRQKQQNRAESGQPKLKKLQVTKQSYCEKTPPLVKYSKTTELSYDLRAASGSVINPNVESTPAIMQEPSFDRSFGAISDDVTASQLGETIICSSKVPAAAQLITVPLSTLDYDSDDQITFQLQSVAELTAPSTPNIGHQPMMSLPSNTLNYGWDDHFNETTMDIDMTFSDDGVALAENELLAVPFTSTDPCSMYVKSLDEPMVAPVSYHDTATSTNEPLFFDSEGFDDAEFDRLTHDMYGFLTPDDQILSDHNDTMIPGLVADGFLDIDDYPMDDDLTQLLADVSPEGIMTETKEPSSDIALPPLSEGAESRDHQVYDSTLQYSDPPKSPSEADEQEVEQIVTNMSEDDAEQTQYSAHSQIESGIHLTSKEKTEILSMQAFVRPCFLKPLTDRSPVIGITSGTLLRTCFRIGEAIRCSNEENIILELFARQTFSSREKGTMRQHFQLADLFHDHRPPYIGGLLLNFKMNALQESESRELLAENKSGQLVRCIGRLTGSRKQGLLLSIINIRETDEEEIERTKRLVEFSAGNGGTKHNVVRSRL